MSLIHAVFLLLPFRVAVLMTLARSIVDVTLVAPALGCAAEACSQEHGSVQRAPWHSGLLLCPPAVCAPHRKLLQLLPRVAADASEQ